MERTNAANNSFTIEHQIVNGGATRFESSLNGLSQIPEGNDGLVGIHDGVRPFVSVNTIKRCYDEAQLTCAAIPVMPLTESLRIVEKNGNSKSVETRPIITMYKRHKCSI